LIELIQTEFQDARHNLALEEAILEDFLSEERSPLIRIWQNEEISIVLGRAEKADDQVHLETCAQREVPILRRVSGGGTVVHGSGNLNISFFLPWSFHPDLKSIPASYALILGWIKEAVHEVTGLTLTTNGTSDLCFNEKKLSGTAQARKRHGLLHHMTLLMDFDLNLIPLLLKEPEKRPDYRLHRNHLDFVTSFKSEGISFSREAFLEGLQRSLGPMIPIDSPDQLIMKRCEDLAQGKYLSKTWNLEGRSP